MNLKTSLMVAGIGAFIASTGMAQTRTFVASDGNDANAGCTRTAPCRSYQAAINALPSGGEVVPIDSAGYGTINIVGKSITIAAPRGIYAGVGVASGNAVTVSGLGASDTVVLSGLALNGSGSATNGILFTGPNGKLIIRDCSATRFTNGINVVNGRVDVIDSDLAFNAVGVRAEGEGVDTNVYPHVATTTIIRMSGGNVTANTTGFHMQNPGSNKANIFGRLQGNSQPSDLTINVGGNTSFTTATNGASSVPNASLGYYVGPFAPL